MNKRLEKLKEAIRAGADQEELYRLDPKTFLKNKTALKKYYMDYKRGTIANRHKNTVYYHIGRPGSGKSYVAERLEGNGLSVFFCGYQTRGALDNYWNDEVLFLDFFTGKNINYYNLLKIMDDEVHYVESRYTNTLTLWNEVHLASIYPPENTFENMVKGKRSVRGFLGEFMSYIDFVVYHYAFPLNGKLVFREYVQPGAFYKSQEDIIYLAIRNDLEYADFLYSL